MQRSMMKHGEACEAPLLVTRSFRGSHLGIGPPTCHHLPHITAPGYSHRHCAGPSRTFSSRWAHRAHRLQLRILCPKVFRAWCQAGFLSHPAPQLLAGVAPFCAVPAAQLQGTATGHLYRSVTLSGMLVVRIGHFKKQNTLGAACAVWHGWS